MTAVYARPPMRAARFPRMIALILSVGVFLSLAGFALAVWSIRNNTNERAAADSIRFLSSSLQDLQAALSSVTIDYNHWEEAYDALLAGDLQWIYDNYTISGLDGVLFDGVIFFSGPLVEPLAWSAAAPQVEPSPPFLTPDILEIVETEVGRQPLGNRQTFDMITVVDGQPVLLSATHLQPYEPARAEGLDPTMAPIAILTNRLDRVALDKIADSLFLPELTFAAQPSAGLASTVVVGHRGEELGYLAWTPPQPGSDTVSTMAPILIAAALLFALLGALTAWLAHSHARHLVWEEAEARRIARTDALTGLPNRLSFAGYLKRLEREGVPQIAVLFLDLNGFKEVNDTIGHSGGDTLIAEVAWRLARVAGEECFLSRLGGDEFVFVLSGTADVARRAGSLAQDVVAALDKPFVILGRTVQISTSQGLALRDLPDVSADELVRRADLAMYRAKRSRTVGAQCYSAELDGQVHPDRDMEEALRGALLRPEEFTILYQPIVDSRSQLLVKAEALARWTSPVLGPVSPSLFIPVAERAGLMNDLGRLLRDCVAKDLACCPDLRVSINLSPIELRDPNLPLDLFKSLARHGVAADRIELELTEGILVEQGDKAAHRLQTLQEMGFTIALDDFGKGFSSLAYLREMPFDTLKIDKSFLSSGSHEVTQSILAGEPEGRQSTALIRAIAQLGSTLGISVVCEGVETQAQADSLRDSGCAHLQGFYFGGPVPLDTLLTNHHLTLSRAA